MSHAHGPKGDSNKKQENRFDKNGRANPHMLDGIEDGIALKEDIGKVHYFGVNVSNGVVLKTSTNFWIAASRAMGKGRVDYDELLSAIDKHDAACENLLEEFAAQREETLATIERLRGNASGNEDVLRRLDDLEKSVNDVWNSCSDMGFVPRKIRSMVVSRSSAVKPAMRLYEKLDKRDNDVLTKKTSELKRRSDAILESLKLPTGFEYEWSEKKQEWDPGVSHYGLV